MVARRWVISAAAVALVAGGLAVAALLAWPRGAVGASGTGLAAVSVPGFAGHVAGITVTDPRGTPLGVSLRDGAIWPSGLLPPGEKLTVTVTFRRPGWIGWLVGRSAERTYTVVTPVAHVQQTFLRPAKGSDVSIRFDTAVSRVSIGGQPARRLGGRTVVPLGVVASGAASEGSTTVAAAVRPWESLSAPVTVSWFVPGAATQVVAYPAVGAQVTPTTALRLTFAEPVSTVLGSQLPKLVPAASGTWPKVDAHTLEFRPAGFGLPLGGMLRVRLPGRTLAWRVARGSTLRLQEILARLGYLPVRWSGPSPSTPSAELDAAVSPPDGTFSWRFANTPASLTRLWQPGRWNVVTAGAVMTFEDEHGLTTDGVAGPAVWRALLRDDLAGRRRPGGYSYVFVHEAIPQSLHLWHNGKVILTSPGNTGIASAPTAQGTWPVFEHISSGTMSGTNPDGSHYDDPGVRWISYFHGGDALHAFPRASYGTPQSLGCVELPYTAAEQVWPYTPIGTLVTIEQ
ncbi:MAG TPA: L,D-transpeptidase family protein [Gaiellaceae bacterium]|nr:L,D-transpeptidase family protein [Gaiellaceae bacterium]